MLKVIQVRAIDRVFPYLLFRILKESTKLLEVIAPCFVPTGGRFVSQSYKFVWPRMN